MFGKGSHRKTPNRKLYVEQLELRQLLASDIANHLNLAMPQLSSRYIAEGEGGPVGTIGQVAPLEEFSADEIFPTLVFTPPVDELISDRSDLSNRTITVGGSTTAFSSSETGTSGPILSGVQADSVSNSSVGTPINVGIVVRLEGDFAGYEGDAPQFRIRTSGLFASSIAVSLGYEAVSPNGASAGVDYYPITIVTIPAYTSFVGVSVPFLRDSLVEGTESFRIRINSVSPGAPVVTFDPARIITGTIFDSTPTNPGDPGDPRVREISINNAVGTEGINPSISFQVTASNNASNAAAVSVFYETFQRSALSGIDYAYRSGFVNFSPNENSKTISIPITNDTIVESTEYFEVRLRSPSVGAVIRTSVGVGSIIDNDVSVRVNVDDAPLVREGAASSFRV